jgi:hypothetical protein
MKNRTTNLFSRSWGASPEPDRTKMFSICVLVAFAIWGAHFGKATQRHDGSPFPPMTFVIESFFANGRYLCLFAFSLAVLIYFNSKMKFYFKKIRSGVFWLFSLNFYLSFKLFFYGKDQFFIEAIAVIAISAVVLVMVVTEIELRSILSPQPVSSKIALIGVLFAGLLVTTNLYALMFHTDSSLHNSRMHGTTINPQHLAMMCALSVAPVIYWIRRLSLASVMGALCGAIYCGLAGILYFTGSRMGFLALVVVTCVSLREWLVGSKFAGGVLLFVVFLGLLGPFLLDDLNSLIMGRFVEGRADTRSGGWTLAWQAFLDNPMFGVAPNELSGRLIFVENFVLAAASTGGFIALALALLVVFGIVSSCFSLMRLQKPGTIERSAIDMYLATASALLIVSLFEAALLGIIAAHTMLAYVYIGFLVNLPSQFKRHSPSSVRMPVYRIHSR